MNKLYYKIIKNKNIYYNYDIKYKIECGLVLKAWEVKSFINGKLDISKSYITIIKNEVFLKNSIFYPINNNFSFIKKEDIFRNRKLLIKKKEIINIYNDIKIYKMIGIIISIFLKYKFIKLEIGISKIIKKKDIREKIKNRNWIINKNRIYKKFK